MPDPLLDALRDFYGYDSFRPQQREIIEHVRAGGDALVLMPTGGGKSLCYQLPAILSDGLTVVVSPLIALMHDQVQALRRAGANAQYLNSTLSPMESAQVERLVASGDVRLLYVAPRARQHRPLPSPAGAPPAQPDRHRRSPLHLRVGPRIPPRLPPPAPPDRALRRCPHRRLHRHRHASGPARHHRPARPPQNANLHHQLPARQPHPAHRAQTQGAGSPGRAIAADPRRSRDRLQHLAQQHRGKRRPPASTRDQGRALPTAP